MVRARPRRSPSTPNMTPPSAHPIMKTEVAIPACSSTIDPDAPGPSKSRMAGLRARLNNCCAMVSNIHPTAATATTNH